ncbi:glycoside hydrolase family 108 protein [Novosphingobium album (ex Liu et al. 2023)]|uniref:Glycosyl hydrolase 108 family protein n=1 Tax=Novosphingobium album (ex Liu et al. 2023) TaxID=3031130 RepID=A0ABT5WXX7_9SPHN|nr:glycosyl hydrolase 108 family protein [Novosphingobium album (ex Liu et al. 2023)]MDE8654763.1 glycosyl hydrolase 108 family protein [Novosphingobium album (ex Liu et al. 2023)]
MAAPGPGPSPAVKGGISAALLAILATVFAIEGGYVDHPNDPGGATNHGVTEQVARRHGYAGDMRVLPKHCAGADDICADRILVRDYVEKPGLAPLVEIEPAVAEEVIDSAVNFGPARPSRWLQLSLNELGGADLSVDGKVGPRTIERYRHYALTAGAGGCVAMLDALDARQAAEYARLVRVNPRLKVFYRGWMRWRVGNVDRARCFDRRWWEPAASTKGT